MRRAAVADGVDQHEYTACRAVAKWFAGRSTRIPQHRRWAGRTASPSRGRCTAYPARCDRLAQMRLTTPPTARCWTAPVPDHVHPRCHSGLVRCTGIVILSPDLRGIDGDASDPEPELIACGPMPHYADNIPMEGAYTAWLAWYDGARRALEVHAARRIPRWGGVCTSRLLFGFSGAGMLTGAIGQRR